MRRSIDHEAFRVPRGNEVRLADFSSDFVADFKDKRDARDTMRHDLKKLATLQEMFYATSRCALLVLFQGMDAAGKDGAIRHVMSGVSPQGIDVTSFKEPSADELAHDYLWRCEKVLPARGRIAIFNRSYYEEVAIVRVHDSLLERERLPKEPSGASLWKARYEDIVAFERHLVRNGTIVLKFFLHLSKDEQRKRLLDRIDVPEKNWKISAADMHERSYWDRYRRAYEALLTNTNTDAAPWYIIPADRKWFARASVADVIVKRLEGLHLTYPVTSDDRRAQLAVERERLVRESPEEKAHV